MTLRSLTRLLGVASLLLAVALIWLTVAELEAARRALAVATAAIAGLTVIFGVVVLTAPIWPRRRHAAYRTGVLGADETSAPLPQKSSKVPPERLGDDKNLMNGGAGEAWHA
jgi:hypothetical protein